MQSITQLEIEQFQHNIFTFYQEKGRDLPWRKTTDPYSILLSEIMLQQTQVERVISYYNRWIKAFPCVCDTAHAPKAKLLSYWSGLGYNNRALRLQQSCKIICAQGFPQTYEELVKLPGIGPYTANAVLAFAFNQDVAVVDTNIRRIFIHEFKLSTDLHEHDMHDIVLRALPKGRSRDWYNALMDYGATYLTAQKTGIKPTSKQSSFKGSTRAVRGSVVKYLLQEKTISYQHAKKLFAHNKFDSIIETMVRDNLVLVKDEMIRLPL